MAKQNKQKRAADLGKDPVGPLLLRLALPTICAQVVNLLYNIVDRIYIGQIPVEGKLALTGMGVTFPVITLISAFAALIGTGGAPRASIAMGAGEHEKAERTLGTCTAALWGLAVVLTALFLLFQEPLLVLFGASADTLPYAMQYLNIYVLGTIFVMTALGLNGFITAQGKSSVAMKTVLICAVLNVVLDPVFIFVFGMGVRGAAVATVLSQLASCAYVLWFLFCGPVSVRIELGGYNFGVMRRVLTIGLTPFIIIALDNVMIIAMNAVLQHYGSMEGNGDALITCATIAQSFMLIVTMPLGGITGGTQTILSYNYGARRPDRVRRAQKFIFAYCLAFTGLMFVLANVFGGLFVRLFTQDDALGAEALRAIRICTLAVLPLGAQYAITDGFTAMGQVRLSLPLSLWRKLVYFSAVFVLPAVFGAKSVFYAEPLSDVIGPVVSIAVYVLCLPHVLARRAPEQGAPAKQTI